MSSKSKYFASSDEEDTVVTMTPKKRKQPSGDAQESDDDGMADDATTTTTKSSNDNTAKKQKPNDFVGDKTASKLSGDGDLSDDDDNKNDGSDSDSSSSDDDDEDKGPLSRSINIGGISSSTANQLRDEIKSQLDEHYQWLFDATTYRPQRYEKAPKYFQPTFQPTSTQPHAVSSGEELTVLCVNEYGSITSRSDARQNGTTYLLTQNTPKRIITSSIHMDEYNYTMATMNQHGILLGAHATYDKKGKCVLPPQITYQCCFDENRQTNFTFDFPIDEDVVGVALTRDAIVVATSKNFLRFFDFSGMEVDISNIPGGLITMSANNSFLCVYYHEERIQSGCGMKVYDTSTGIVLYEARASYTPQAFLTWAYTSPKGINYTCDSDGWIRQFSYARGFDWKTVGRLTAFQPDREFTIWPVYIEHCVTTAASDDKKTEEHHQKLYFIECYKRKEPIPAAQLPALKSNFLRLPFLKVLEQQDAVRRGQVDDKDKKAVYQFEQTARERLIWDEYAMTDGECISATMQRQYDTPWVFLGIQLAQMGSTTRAIYAAKQIRDVDVLRKFIERVNSLTHLPDLDNVITQLQAVLQQKLYLKKTQAYPYLQPLPFIAQIKHNQIKLEPAAAPVQKPIEAKKLEIDNPFAAPVSTPSKMQNAAAPGSNNPFRKSTSSNPFTK